MNARRKVGIVLVFGAMALALATQVYGAEMLSCHGVYGWQHPSHQLAMDALVGLIATLGAILFLA